MRKSFTRVVVYKRENGLSEMVYGLSENGLSESGLSESGLSENCLWFIRK